MPIDFLIEINIHIMRFEANLTHVKAMNSLGEDMLVMEL